MRSVMVVVTEDGSTQLESQIQSECDARLLTHEEHPSILDYQVGLGLSQDSGVGEQAGELGVATEITHTRTGRAGRAESAGGRRGERGAR